MNIKYSEGICHILLLVLLFFNTAAVADNVLKKEVELSINEIISNEPFPQKIISNRWIIDLDDETDQKEDSDSSFYMLPEIIIQLLALFSEHILFLVLIVIFLSLYFNRHLLGLEKIRFKSKRLLKISTGQIESNEIQPDNVAEVKSKVDILYQQGRIRELISLLYKHFLTENHHDIHLTEYELLQVLGSTEDRDYVNLLVELRIQTAYQHNDSENSKIRKLLQLWHER